MVNQVFFTRIYFDADDAIRTEPTQSFSVPAQWSLAIQGRWRSVCWG
jgi:hypothetical protein